MKSEAVGLSEVSVEGFQAEGVTGCLAALSSLGIIRSESQARQVVLGLAPGDV